MSKSISHNSTVRKKTQRKQAPKPPSNGRTTALPLTLPQDRLDHGALDAVLVAMDKLDPTDFNLLMQYYMTNRDLRNDLADSMGIGLAALRARVYRVQSSLRSAAKEYLSQISQLEPHRIASIVPVLEKFQQLEPGLISHLKEHNDDLLKINPLLFEHLFAEFLAARGFDDVRLVGRNPKTSADIFAAKFIPGPDIPIRVFVEVKRWKHTIGIEVINKVLGAFMGERERFGWNVALVVTVGGFSDFEKWSREELALKGLYLKDRDDLLRYLDGYKQHENGLWLPNPRTDL